MNKLKEIKSVCVGVSFAFKQLKNLNKLNEVGDAARRAAFFIVCVCVCVLKVS